MKIQSEKNNLCQVKIFFLASLAVISLSFAPKVSLAFGAPDYLPDGTHPRVHSTDDIVRMASHYNDNDVYWTKIKTEADRTREEAYSDAHWMYHCALAWKVTSNSAYYDKAYDVLNDLVTGYTTNYGTTFDQVGGNNNNAYRAEFNWFIRTYDLFYNNLAEGDRIAIGDRLHFFANYHLQSGYDDTDQIASDIRSYVMVGIVTYGNGSSTYSNSDCLTKAHYVKDNSKLDDLMDWAGATGWWWEGLEYNSHTRSYIVELWRAMIDGFGWDYKDKKGTYADIYDNWVKWALYEVPPNQDVDSALTYSDDQGSYYHFAAENYDWLAGLSLIAGDDFKPVARWWVDYLYGDGASVAYNVSAWAFIWHDDSLSRSNPTTIQDKIWFSPSMISTDTYQTPVKFYYATDWGSNGTMLASNLAPRSIDHVHDDQGNFFFWRNGERLLWEYSAYNSVNYGHLLHNTLQVYNPNPGYEDFYPRIFSTRELSSTDKRGFQVGIKRYKTDAVNYLYANQDFYGAYNPHYYIYAPNDQEIVDFVSTAERNFVVIGDYLFLHDRNLWSNRNLTRNYPNQYRVHRTIWHTSGVPVESDGIVSGVTPGGQYMYGHYLLPTDNEFTMEDDTNQTTSDISNCDIFGWPECDILKATVKAQPTTVREEENFLNVYYAKDNSGAKTVNYLGQDESTAIGGDSIGAVIHDSSRDMVALFSKYETDQNSVTFELTPDGSNGMRVIAADLIPDESYSVSVANVNNRRIITIDVVGSEFNTDESGLLAFDVSLNGAVTLLGTSEVSDTTAPQSPYGLAVM